MQFLYGNNVLKSGLARITENTPTYTGVVIYNMADIPLGFGVTAKSTNECRSLDPSAVVAFHQADCGAHGGRERKWAKTGQNLERGAGV
jgi:60S ribosome subunit biogenesis protein NIP7